MQKKTILFVDDEPRVLDGLRRMLHDMSRDWDMQFARGGEEALAAMSRRSCDALVSDLCMPGMDGEELVQTVKRLYPSTIRIILSAHGRRESMMKVAHSAHEFLVKPCDPDALTEAIERNLAVRESIECNEARSMVMGMDPLPMMPQIYDCLENTTSSLATLCDEKERVRPNDIALTAELFHLALFLAPQLKSGVYELDHIFGVLGDSEGMQELRSSWLPVILPDNIVASFRLGRLCEHSFTVGSRAASILHSIGNDPCMAEHATVAGRLHDVGKLIFITKKSEEYEAVFDRHETEDIPLHVVEPEVFGIDHARLGAHLLNLWGLPEDIVEAVALHHTPLKPSDSSSCLRAVLYLANAVQHQQL
jgi:putative nucleotidyltransferase with HDIG domain